MKFFTTASRDAVSEPDLIGPRQAARVRELRVEAARRVSAWEEIPRERLISRGYKGQLLVDSATDHVYARVLGQTFDGARVAFNEARPLAFTVVDGDVLMLERQSGTWTERYERQARAEARQKAVS